MSGLSLCIQGTSARSNFANNIIRFIPVYTGNIITKLSFGQHSAVYPCVYREHSTTACSPMPTPGLSLCIQGTLSLKEGVCR